MSRIAKAPVELPQGVTATIAPGAVTIKGAKGSLSLPLTGGVSVEQTEKKLEYDLYYVKNHTLLLDLLVLLETIRVVMLGEGAR